MRKRMIETGWVDPQTQRSYKTNFSRFECPFQMRYKLQRIDNYFRRQYISPYGVIMLIVIFIVKIVLKWI